MGDLFARSTLVAAGSRRETLQEFEHRILENDLRMRSRRVSFRVSLSWKDPQTDANRRKPTKESEDD